MSACNVNLSQQSQSNSKLRGELLIQVLQTHVPTRAKHLYDVEDGELWFLDRHMYPITVEIA